MRALHELRQQAVGLRMQGFTYGEILHKVPVAKSTLSLWIRSVGLGERARMRIIKKRKVAQRRASDRVRQLRLVKTAAIKEQAFKEINVLTDREMWLVGIALYWGGGTKEKEYDLGRQVELCNADPRLARFFLLWLMRMGISVNDLYVDLSIHETAEQRVPEVLNFWRKYLGLGLDVPMRVYYKRHRPKTTIRKNTQEN